MRWNIRLAINVNILVHFKSEREVVFDAADDVLLHVAVNFGDDGVQVRHENIDMVVFAETVGELHHRVERAQHIAQSHICICTNSGEDCFFHKYFLIKFIGREKSALPIW